jgi:hypothetical protein
MRYLEIVTFKIIVNLIRSIWLNLKCINHMNLSMYLISTLDLASVGFIISFSIQFEFVLKALSFVY